jgi:uncharacterized protein (DUF2147 family)
MKHVVLSLVLAVLTAVPAFAADPAIGLWKTEPDRKDLISHIEIRECGAALCGRIKVAFDPSGQEVMTKNIGKELFWDMVPNGGGAYSGGTVWVPLLNVKAKATMQLTGKTLVVEGCKAMVCDGQVWTRIQ